MRILIFSTTDILKAAYSRPHHLIAHLSKSHEILVICINAWWLKGEKNQFLYNHKFNKNITIEYLTLKEIGPVFQEFLFIFKLKQYYKSNYDIFINFDSIFAGVLLARKIKKRKIHVLFDIDDDVPEMIKTSMSIPFYLRHLGCMFGKLMIIMFKEIPDTYTFTLRSLAKSYEDQVSQIYIIPNGVNLKIFNITNTTKLLKDTFIDTNKHFVLGYVGVLREWVDFETIFLVIKSINIPLKLLIVGEEGKLNETKEKVHNLELDDQVIFCGTVPYLEVPHYISLMDICLIPFKINPITEGALPLKLFEYMACGKPIISTPLLGIKEVVGERVLYACDEFSMKSEILKLYYDEKLRNNLGIEGRKFVEENYDWKQICARFEEILEAHVKPIEKLS